MYICAIKFDAGYLAIVKLAHGFCLCKCLQFSFGDIKAKNIFEGVPLALPLPVSANLDYTMVGTRKRKGWDDNSGSSEPPSSKISRDQLLLSDCLDNINTDTSDLTSVDNDLMHDHKRDTGESS